MTEQQIAQWTPFLPYIAGGIALVLLLGALKKWAQKMNRKIKRHWLFKFGEWIFPIILFIVKIPYLIILKIRIRFFGYDRTGTPTGRTNIDRSIKDIVIARDGQHCTWPGCHVHLGDGIALVVDHHLPVKHFPHLADKVWNYRTLCARHNGPEFKWHHIPDQAIDWNTGEVLGPAEWFLPGDQRGAKLLPKAA